MGLKFHYLNVLILMIMLFLTPNIFGSRCDRKPYGSSTSASPPDGRFKLEVEDVDTTYIPDQLYNVKITETDGESTFTAFMISIEGDSKPDPSNPRRLLLQFPGELRPRHPNSAKFSERCIDSLEQVTNAFKSSIEVYWQAPSSGNGCVTIRAMVAESDDIWFADGAPLSKKVCEDLSQPDDVAPLINYNCQLCNEAKYEVAFEGIWSRNTHPRLFPENDWVPRYSDLVGASHAADHIIWVPGTLATQGLRDVAEHANTTQIETELKVKIGNGVRTIIKGKGHGYPKLNNPTYSFFRTDKTNHLVTVAVGIHPSPDWFLGVTRFELCQEDNTWLKERELNLFPWDAGTDSGVSYEAANIETFPQDAVSRVQMSSYDKNSPFFEVDMKDLHPFGKLHIKLIRTYHRECKDIKEDTTTQISTSTDRESQEENTTTTEFSTTTDITTETSTLESDTTPSEPEEPARYQYPEIRTGENGGKTTIKEVTPQKEQCPMTDWEDWSACEGNCVNGKLVGYKWRERYHLVKGVPVGKYNTQRKYSGEYKISDYCENNFETFETDACNESCIKKTTNVDITAERRRGYQPLQPGSAWQPAKKRNLTATKNII